MVTRYPAFWPALALVAGINFARFLPVDWRFGFVTALTCFATSRLWKLWITFPAWFFLGASLLTFRMDDQSPADLRNLFGLETELTTIRGVLTADPEHRVLDQDQRTRYRTTALVSVTEVERRNQWEPASGELAVATTGFVPEHFLSGAVVEISGSISLPQGPSAPGLFDYEQFLKWQRIHFVLRAETNDWKLLKEADGWNSATLYRKFNTWARDTLQRGIPQDQNTRLLWAMVLGWKQGLTNDVSEPFMRTGTLHIFAISGLHIALIAGMLIKFLRGLWLPKIAFGLSRVGAGLVVVPLIWFYTGATGWQASAIRSTIMCTVIIVSWALRRPKNLLNSLSVSAILILLWQPEQLFQPGFQLSFVLLLSLATWPGIWPGNPWPDPTVHLGQRLPDDFARKVEVSAWSRMLARAYEWMTGRDPFLPEELRPWWRRKSDAAAEWLLGGLNISLASLLGSLPLTIWYFNLISFSSLLANLLIVPISGLALGLSIASLAIGWAPWLPEWLNWIAWLTMKLMVAICQWLEDFRWTYTYVQSPGVLTMVVYYSALICLLRGWLRDWRVACGMSGAIIVLVAASVIHERTTTSLTVLPGSGVAFIDAPGSRDDLLIDCGREREAMALVKPFLHSRGVDRLGGMLLTHGDVEHVEGYFRLAEEFEPRLTFTSAARSRSPRYRDILADLELAPGRWKKVVAGESVLGWQVLHPKAGDDFSRADDDAVVLKRTIDGVRMALLSDLGRNGQQRLAEASLDLKCDVLIGGVGTDNDPMRAALLERMGPKVIVLTGNDARTARAARELKARGAPVVATMEERAVTLERRTLSGMKGGFLKSF